MTLKLFYLANIRLPTEKAHGLQIMQMCEAFACTKVGTGEVKVTLIVPRRDNSPEMAQIHDVWAYYGVQRNFAIWRIVCLDLFRWILPSFGPTAFLTDQLRSLTTIGSLLFTLSFRRADMYYSRDLLTVLALSLFKPRRSLVYEAHQLAHSRIGGWLQRRGVRRAGLVVAVTARLGADLAAYGARHVHVAHDGIRLERFADLPDQASARARFKLPADAFIAGYMGQLHTMSMSKGVDVLIDAIAQAGRDITICLVGGPESMADVLRQRWLSLGLPAERFIFVGRVNPPDVPACLAAFDVCTMPFPWTEHFAYYASPLKLFEYMASGRAIVGSDLPSTAEVVRDGETALLVPASDAAALAAALSRLHDDPALRERIGRAAQQDVGRYSWQARADGILRAVNGEAGR